VECEAAGGGGTGERQVSQPRLLDLFCGAGGAAMGYHRAGFDVFGVDIERQSNYPFEFVQMDAMSFLELDGYLADASFFWDFDAIHASPPCPRYTSMQSVARNADAHPDLISEVRELLNATGLPWVIENVPGAPLIEPFRLCGSSFGLGCDMPFPFGYEGAETIATTSARRQLRRHRLFETNWPIGLVPPCAHRGKTVGLYGDHLRFGRRSSDGELSGPAAHRLGKLSMDIDWDVTWAELKDMVPPAYTQYIGHQLMQHLKHTQAVAS
jgi:DNA (cytosine-5)-methyltransferase 1